MDENLSPSHDNPGIQSQGVSQGTVLLQKVFEDISVPQIYAACDAAQKAPTFRSQYSFNQKWFSITYCETGFPLDPNTPTIPPHQTGKFHAEFQKKNGQKGIIVGNTIGEILSLISTFSKKEEPKKEIADTMDMGEYFDTVIFTELCENVSHSIQKKGAYMLNQNTYTVHERVQSTGDILTYYTPTQYIVEYPGRFSRETTGETLHINDKLIAESPTVPNLIQWLTHEHGADLKQKKVGEEKGPIFFSKEGFVELCEYIRDHVPDRKGKYDFNGTKYPLWIKLKGLFFGYVYYAEMPQKNNSTITVSARTPEKLYEKIFGPIITIENT